MLFFISMSLCICLLLFADLGKSTSLLYDSIINLGHVPLFAMVAGMTLWVLDRVKWVSTDKKNYGLAVAISAFLALTTEIIQNFTPERSFQAGDILNDIIGAGTFLAIAYQFRRELKSRTRVFLCSTVYVSLMISCMPVIVAFADEMRAREDFPLLGSFETRWEMGRWKSEESSFRRVSMYATDGYHSLETVLSPGLYPGITMDYPPRDWRGYENLTFDAHLEGTEPLPLTVRINDLAHNEEFNDRYNRTFTLQPGANRLNIDLSEVEHAPKGRLMDMEHISILCIFSYKLQEPRTVYFDNFRLDKDI